MFVLNFSFVAESISPAGSAREISDDDLRIAARRYLRAARARARGNKINNEFLSFGSAPRHPRPSLSAFPFSRGGFKLTIPIRWETSVNTFVLARYLR